MCAGIKKASGAGGERDFQKIARIDAKNRAAVGFDVADAGPGATTRAPLTRNRARK